jgi:hypothetical protein
LDILVLRINVLIRKKFAKKNCGLVRHAINHLVARQATFGDRRVLLALLQITYIVGASYGFFHFFHLDFNLRLPRLTIFFVSFFSFNGFSAFNNHFGEASGARVVFLGDIA